MTTLEIPADVDLRDLVSAPGRTSSVYFRRPAADEATAERRHGVVARLAEQGAGSAMLRAVDEVLCDVRPGDGAVAVFAAESGNCDARDHHGHAGYGHAGHAGAAGHAAHPAAVGDISVLSMPGAATPDSATYAALPNLLPLLAWRQSTPGHVLAALDRARAEGTRRHHPEPMSTAAAECVEARTRRLLEDLAVHLRPRGLAVEGAPAVLHALSQGRVRTLLIIDTEGDERVVWFGESAAELSGHRAQLEISGAAVRHGRLVDAAVRAAVLTGADIRILRPGTAGAPAQGLGALCRCP